MDSGQRSGVLFTSSQVERLRKLAVTTEQIQELERILPGCDAMLGPSPRMADVRDELQQLDRALQNAADCLQRFRSAGDRVPALREAHIRVQMAAQETSADADGYLIDKSAIALKQLSEWVRVATTNLQPRKNRVSTWPIGRIHEALVRGWGSTYYRVHDGPFEYSVVNALASPPPLFPHLPSSGVTSPFRQIVGICFEAIGVNYTDPERQIKSFVRWYREDRRRGHQGAEESGLPS